MRSIRNRTGLVVLGVLWVCACDESVAQDTPSDTVNAVDGQVSETDASTDAPFVDVTDNADAPYAPDAPSVDGRRIEQVVTGGGHACAVRHDGTVQCWGVNSKGQLGLGDIEVRGDQLAEMGAALTPVDIGGLVRAMTLGFDFSCALLLDGNVKCWGNNGYGQLGLGDTTARGSVPGQMGSALGTIDLGVGRTATAISAGKEHACALLDSGQVKCWGNNANGRLGLGDVKARGDAKNEMGDQLPTVQLGKGRSAKAIACGAMHTCALLDNSQVKCWGDNSGGQLGLGDTENRGESTAQMGDALASVLLGVGRTVKSLAAGYAFNCAILDDDALKCWGGNVTGELGLESAAWHGMKPSEMGDALPSVNLGKGRAASKVTGGLGFACALLDIDAVKCWGANGYGQLGLGDTATRGLAKNTMGDALPEVSLGGKVSTVSAGHYHACAVLSDGRVKCWGFSGVGALGLGDKERRGDGPGEMGSALPAVDLGK